MKNGDNDLLEILDKLSVLESRKRDLAEWQDAFWKKTISELNPGGFRVCHRGHPLIPGNLRACRYKKRDGSWYQYNRCRICANFKSKHSARAKKEQLDAHNA